jgi:hypothetical protein
VCGKRLWCCEFDRRAALLRRQGLSLESPLSAGPAHVILKGKVEEVRQGGRVLR